MTGTYFVVQPGGTLSGRLRVPGDKSISHRAIMFAAIAQGTSRITGFLESADCLATLNAFTRMGLTHHLTDDGIRVIEGLGKYGLRAPDQPLDLGNSGTSMRLLAGLMVGQTFDSVLTGDDSLSRRPMKRIIGPLTQMGAHIEGDAAGRAPLSITGNASLTAVDYTPPVASAQIKSCVLLAGLYADGTTQINEPGVSRDHTERMLSAFGVEIERAGRRISMAGKQDLTATDVAVPADLSSAAFFMVGAAIAPDSDMTLTDVGINPTRRGVIDILMAMGARIELQNERDQAGETVADVRVQTSALRGIDIDADLVELAIDECPAIFVAAACAQGTTRVTGAAELRVKECDRIAVMAEGLQRLGVACEEVDDGLTIVGSARDKVFSGGAVASHEDHRIAMSFAMAGLRAAEAITIDDCDYVDTSFPGFVDLARTAGLGIDQTSSS